MEARLSPSPLTLGMTELIRFRSRDISGDLECGTLSRHSGIRILQNCLGAVKQLITEFPFTSEAILYNSIRHGICFARYLPQGVGRQ